jgi:hypothetical protein
MWQLVCKLLPAAADPPSADTWLMYHRVSVLDARALGDPGFLGEAHIDVASLSLEPNSPPVNLWLPLKVRHDNSSTHAQPL